MDKSQSHQIAQIIFRIKCGIATVEEKRLFEAWVKEKADRRALYDKIVAGESLKEYRALVSEYERKTDYGKLHADILNSLARRNKQKKMKRHLLWYASAAAVLIFGCMFLFKYAGSGSGEPGKMDVAKIESESVMKDKVMLILADGRELRMSEIQHDSMRIGSVMVKGKKEMLVYDSDRVQRDSLQAEVVEMNKMVTATGGFYALELSDGSRVWLNAESELVFPVFFGAGERIVQLKGEAFFEVVPDAARPFIVETNDTRTRVLGTTFNVKAYENESHVTTTLFTGKVNVSLLTDSTCSAVLSPGKQADWDMATGKWSVADANLENISAWKKGMFVFNREDIRVVTRQIERWYGVQFIYDTDREKNYTFNGYFSKDETLKSILDAFTFTGGPEFRIEGNVVYVRDKE